MLLTFPVMGIKLNSVDQTVEWQFDRVILLGVAIFFLSMLWNWCFSRKARGIPLIRLPEGLGKGLHSLVTLPNRNTTTRLTSLGLLLAVMIVMPLVSSFYQTNIMISAMLYVILALGLNIAVGIAGLCGLLRRGRLFLRPAQPGVRPGLLGLSARGRLHGHRFRPGPGLPRAAPAR